MSLVPGTNISQHTLRAHIDARKPPAPRIMQQRNLEAHNIRGPYAHNAHATECTICHATHGARMIATYASRANANAQNDTFVCTQCANEDIDGRRVPFHSDRVYKSTQQIHQDFTDYLLDAIITRTNTTDPLPHDLIAILRTRNERDAQ